MELNLKWPLLAATSLLWIVLQGMVNHSLGAWGVQLLLTGLLPVMPALWLSWRSGLALMALCAFFTSATVPAGAILYVLLFCGGFALVHPYRVDIIRGRIPRILATVLMINLLFFIGLTLWALPQSAHYGTFWLRSVSDLLCSSAVLALAGYVYVSLQHNLLEMVHARPA